MSRLDAYRRKRDFNATPEPQPRRSAKAEPGTLAYVVQLHHARSRHFDFRLELSGSLLSWAVPKGPSLDPSQKRLAVEVEDHPLDYASFEGDIPEGHYGAGHVDIWDRGQWRPEGDPDAGLNKGHLGFELLGARLHGHWDLIRTRYTGRQPQWLLVKREDAFARPGDVADDLPLREAIPEVANAPGQSAHPRHKSRNDKTKPRTAAVNPGSGTALPKRVGLQLARLVEQAPASGDWLHEIKYDGYRALLSREAETVRIASRNDIDWTTQLPSLVAAVTALPCRSCMLDTELVVIDAAGRSRFDLLQARFSDKAETGIRAIAFDLLFLDGNDLRPLPQDARKQALGALLANTAAPLKVAEYLEGNGPAAAKAACKAGLEGIVSKLRGAPYEEGRGGAWLKTKCVDGDEFVIVGHTPGKGARARLGSLLLAESRPGTSGWRYVGRVGSGLGDDQIDTLLRALKPASKPANLDGEPGRADLRGASVVWVRPTTVVEIEFRGRTADGLLRQASLKGLRVDRSPRSLRQPDKAPRLASATRGKVSTMKSKASKNNNDVDQYFFTHPDRLLFGKPKITKRALGRFYADVAHLMLPELIRRPLSVMRCPDGVGKECFFQKHSSPGFSENIREIPISSEKSGTQDYFYIENLDGLLGLVQMSVIELHPWGSRIDDLELPDRLVFDLDPADDVKWKRVIAAALLLRERLDHLKLRSFVRTSGGKGLHVVVPLTPSADWETAKAFTQAMAQTLAEEQPQEFVAVATKAKRGGRIFIDYLRNGRGATSVASYSLRAREDAPVSTPLSWEELPKLRSGAQYRYRNFAKRLAACSEDPWQGIASVRQKLPGTSAARKR